MSLASSGVFGAKNIASMDLGYPLNGFDILALVLLWFHNDLLRFPYLVRFKQCLSMYNSTKSNTEKDKHFYNAIKYLTAIPMTLCSFLIPITARYYFNLSITSDANSQLRYQHMQETMIIFLFSWLGFGVINSVYSLYWDLVNDWLLFETSPFGVRKVHESNDGKDLPISIQIEESPVSGAYQNPRLFLRKKLHFHPAIYYLAIFVNIVLRFAWLTKVYIVYELATSFTQIQIGRVETDRSDTRMNVHIAGVVATAVFIDAMLVCLEIFRRFVWVMIRVESDWVNRQFGYLGVGDEQD